MFFKNSNIKQSFFKNNIHLFILFFITLIGLYFRVLGINKTGGFWLDEAYCCYDAEASFPFGIFNRVLHKDLHSPLYFFILHFWMKIFGNHDITIRLLSVIFGVLLLPVLYSIGKELYSKKTGLIMAALASVNSLLIYYSQEVKFYSLLTLLSGLSVLFLLKIRDCCHKKYLAALTVTNLVLLYTFPLCTIFVFLEALIFFIYLCFTKKSIKLFIIAQIITLTLYLPYLSVFLHNHTDASSSKAFIDVFWWTGFNPVSILLVIQDWFSLLPVNLIDTPLTFYNLFNINFAFIMLILIPVIIYLIGIIRALKEKSFAGILFLIGFFFFITEIILSMRGSLALMSKYTILVLPIMIVTGGYGFSKLKSINFSTFLITFLLLFSVFYLRFSPQSTSLMKREEGFRSVANILNRYNLDKTATIIMPYGGNMLYRYYNKSNLFHFDYNEILLSADNKELSKIFEPNIIKTLNKANSYDILKNYIGSPYPSKVFENYIEREIIKKTPHNKYIVLVKTRGVALYDTPVLSLVVSDSKKYKNSPLFVMLASKLNNDMLDIFDRQLIHEAVTQDGFWSVYIYKKP